LIARELAPKAFTEGLQGIKGGFSPNDEDENIRDAFDPLSRTDNVKGVNWMLADQHQDFGDKQIKKIYVFLAHECTESCEKMILAYDKPDRGYASHTIAGRW